jgi:alpha-glucosidase
MKKLIGLLSLFLFTSLAFAQNYTLTSPNGNIQVAVEISDDISWSASLKGNLIIEQAQVAMDFSKGADLGAKMKVKKHNIENLSSTVRPVLPHKDAIIKDECTELSIRFKQGFTIKFRAYNDGVAYQIIDDNKEAREVMTETISITFPEGTQSLFPEEESMYSHNERLYLDKNISDIAADQFGSLPLLFMTDHGKVLFTETALHDYPGMFIKGNGNHTLEAIFPKYVLKAVDSKAWSDRTQTIVEEADYIAKVSGKRDYPWRVFIISDDDRTFIESNLTFQLAKPLALENTDWIKPGKVAWDWYNANNIYGVDFKSGLNTATYKYYIDFAAANDIEYVILDEGWTKSTTEILGFNPDIDVPELIRYGKTKGVELILWVLWKPLDANMDEILETYASWGVSGIKVDFMQRNDQYMVSSYEQIAKKCAELELLVDYHGAFKPSGLRRVYPNVINYEGVMGNEQNKWSADITPEHNVTLPFIRMAAGPLDFTPGAMANAHKINYKISFERPMGLGTRAHQVAMYVIYEAPLQMMCESPSKYYQEQETVDFITQIPTTWDETIVLHAAVGDYVALARRKGDQWYIGAMTDDSPRDLELDLSFLGAGAYQAEVFKDGMNANRVAVDYKKEVVEVDARSKLKISMVGGGGWSAVVRRK